MGLGFTVPIAYVAWKARGRLRRFENQLPDLLITLAASLKAGHSFRQGIQSVVEEGAEPAADEFKRVLTETQLGKPMDNALANMAERVGSSNLTFVVTAVTIQRQIGGSLAGLFDMVAETVRQRQQFARKVKSLTAMGRMSAYVLVGLPFFMAAVVTLMNPAYMAPLWHTGIGHTMVISGVTMIGLGSLMLKKIASVRG
jgi:tight adherence protein B